MEALLDTHTLVWWFAGSSMLSRRVSTILAHPGNIIHVSAVVGWEIAIKFNLGKLRSPELVEDMGGFLAQEGWRELPINLQHAMNAGLLPLHHRDPFDRLLVPHPQPPPPPILRPHLPLDRYEVRRLW